MRQAPVTFLLTGIDEKWKIVPAREEALPYYKWLWRDFRSNRKVQRMGWVARGLYRELLDEAWSEGSIPTDMNELADICGCPLGIMLEAWPRIEPCWRLDEMHGRFVNDKLDSLRTEVDHKRVVNAANGRKGGLAKLANEQRIIANAKRSPNVASKRHIAEQSRADKKREEPSVEESTADERHKPFKLAIFAAWPEGEPDWNGREGSVLSKVLAANPKLTLEGFKRLLKHRRESEGVNLYERPCMWLEKVTKYAGGPLDRYGKPLQVAKPAPQLRGVTLAEAMQR